MRSCSVSSRCLAPSIRRSWAFQRRASSRRANSKPIDKVFDLTLVLADVSDKALAQIRRGAVELLTPRMEQHAAELLAGKLAGGHWTHDYALTASEAAELGLPVKVGMPLEIITLMKLYPQPIQQSGVEYLPIDIPRRRRLSLIGSLLQDNLSLSKVRPRVLQVVALAMGVRFYGEKAQ